MPEYFAEIHMYDAQHGAEFNAAEHLDMAKRYTTNAVRAYTTPGPQELLPDGTPISLRWAELHVSLATALLMLEAASKTKET